MSTLIHERVEAARKGKNPHVVHRVESGWVVIGDFQFLSGYCLLLPDPVVSSLNDLDMKQRARFLLDMASLGDALLEVTGAYRINYDILGNSEAALHAHVFPRYETGVDDMRRGPAFFYDWKDAIEFDPERDRPLMQDIARALKTRD